MFAGNREIVSAIAISRGPFLLYCTSLSPQFRSGWDGVTPGSAAKTEQSCRDEVARKWSGYYVLALGRRLWLLAQAKKAWTARSGSGIVPRGCLRYLTVQYVVSVIPKWTGTGTGTGRPLFLEPPPWLIGALWLSHGGELLQYIVQL
jgi:hypothetical protein